MSATLVRRTLLTAVWMVAGLTATAGAGGRLVAVGDVHGSYDGLVEILGRAGLINSEAHWIGGDATLVQTGDLFDRGLEVRAVLDLLMRLQGEAKDAGGEVVALLGNHEMMNLLDYYRDVNPDMYVTFADENSEKRRKAGYKAFKSYWIGRAKAAGASPPNFTDEVKAQWMAAHPPGRIEYQEALGPEGRYGAWLRERPVAVVIDDTLFVHGGLGPALAGMTVEEINQRAAEELKTFDNARTYMVEHGMVPPTAGLVSVLTAYRELEIPDPALAGLADVDQWLIQSPDGPVWFRGAARWDETEHGAEIAALLTGIGAERMVVGHTVQAGGRIQVRFGGRVILIDTGMLSSVYAGGGPSALVIENGVYTALYPDSSETLDVDEALPEAA
jgi:hypothetical protein